MTRSPQSGTIFSLAMIVSTALSENAKLSAIIFFVFSLVYHMANLILYQFLFNNVSNETLRYRNRYKRCVTVHSGILYDVQKLTRSFG